MSAKINYAILESNAELVRNAVGAILKVELDSQYTNHYNEESQVEAFGIERTNPLDFTETSYINVSLDNSAFIDKNYGGAVTAEVKIYITAMTRSKSGPGYRGDEKSRRKCIRLLNMCRFILDDPQYKTVDFEPGFVNTVGCQSFEMTDAEKYDSTLMSMGQLVFSAVLTENNRLLDGVPLMQSITSVKIEYTDQGLLYAYIN